MAQSTRVFAAISLPESRTAKLEQLQQRVGEEPEAESVRWVARDQMHLTLAFLGEVLDVDLGKVCQAIKTACQGQSKFELSLEGIGVFPKPTAPRVLWAGLTGSSTDLNALDQIQRAVVTEISQVGWPPVDNRFTPHVTIGRFRPGPESRFDVTPWLLKHSRWKGGSFKVNEVVLYSSDLKPSGPIYQPLTRIALK